jgi:hypothetical protein
MKTGGREDQYDRDLLFLITMAVGMMSSSPSGGAALWLVDVVFMFMLPMAYVNLRVKRCVYVCEFRVLWRVESGEKMD